jgi:hypothetical protein
MQLSTFFSSFSIQSSIGTLNYVPALNMFSTQGYTSLAGNTYFQGIQISQELIVKVNFGIGHSRDFINGIKIYTADDNRLLLAQEGYNCFFFSQEALRAELCRLMFKALLDANQQRGLNKPEHELRQYANELIHRVSTTPQQDLVVTKKIPLLAG